jgi:hypothetical protein
MLHNVNNTLPYVVVPPVHPTLYDIAKYVLSYRKTVLHMSTVSQVIAFLITSSCCNRFTCALFFFTFSARVTDLHNFLTIPARARERGGGEIPTCN